jgi:hypothetical protein
MDIKQHIENDKEILDNSTTSPQMRRHIEAELDSLEKYEENHPDASECRMYDN